MTYRIPTLIAERDGPASYHVTVLWPRGQAQGEAVAATTARKAIDTAAARLDIADYAFRIR